LADPAPSKLLRLHLSEGDRWHDQPLYAAIVDKCRELGIAGATVFRGIEGYGETAEIHRSHLLHHDAPIVISVVDSADNIARLVPEVEAMMNKGMIAISDVEAVRIRNSRA
jgi:uncharacterized protein